MLNSLKKKALKKVLVQSILMILIGGALLAFQGMSALYAIMGPKTFEDLTPDEIHNHQRVNVALTGALGAFMYEYEETSSGTKLSTTAYYYAIYSGGENADIDYALMAIKVPASLHSSMEDLAEYYNDYGWSEEPIYFENAEIRKMHSDELSTFRDVLEYTDAEFDEYCIPYVIDATEDSGSMIGMAYILTLAGLILVIISLIRLIYAGTGASLKRLREDIAESGHSDATVESDFSSAVSFTKNDEVKIGRLFTYYMNGSTPRLIPNSKLLWAYQSSTTHRRNGIKVATTYSVTIYVDDKRNCLNLAMPNEAVTQEVLKRINAILPWVVVGYSDELKNMFNKNRSQFLDLRYNTVEHIAVEPGFENFSAGDMTDPSL